MKIIFQSFNIKYSDFQKFITFRRNKNPVSAKAGTTKKTLYCPKSAQKKTPEANRFRSLFVRVDFAVTNCNLHVADTINRR